MPKVISGLKGRDVLSNLKECVKTSINSAKEIDINNLSNFKFKKAIRWPYPENGDCNFIEFINQLFTTVASIKAIEYLKAEEDDWVMNLGTTPGRDLTVKKDSENIIIIAEIFAVTDPQSNNKLKDEIISLATLSKEEEEEGEEGEKEDKRYAFFILSEDKFPKNKNDTKSVISWTTKQSSNGNILIKFKKDSFVYDKDKKMAMWTAICQSDTQPREIEVNIVCWSSENCLLEFL